MLTLCQLSTQPRLKLQILRLHLSPSILRGVSYGRIGSKHRHDSGSRSKSVGIGRRLCRRAPERIVIDVDKCWLTYVADVAPPVGPPDTTEKSRVEFSEFFDFLDIDLDESD